MSGTILIIHPDGKNEERRITKTSTAKLEDLQAAVGGYIERCRIKYNGVRRDAYVDEEGSFKPHLNVNPIATGLVSESRGVYTPIVGPIAIWIPDTKAMRKNNVSSTTGTE
jgi:hypothetical protein